MYQTHRAFGIFMEQFKNKFFITLIKLHAVSTACIHSSVILIGSCFW